VGAEAVAAELTFDLVELAVVDVALAAALAAARESPAPPSAVPIAPARAAAFLELKVVSDCTTPVLCLSVVTTDKGVVDASSDESTDGELLL
jgi:hypothetical protein